MGSRYMVAISKLIYKLSFKIYNIRAWFIKHSFHSCGKGFKAWGIFSIKNPDKLTVGNYVSINDFVYINAKGGVSIGNDVALSVGCKIISTSLDYNNIGPNKIHIDKEIIIGNKVQIGAGAIILPGVTIGNNVVVGAGSVVTESIGNNTIVAGVPARKIRDLNNE